MNRLRTLLSRTWLTGETPDEQSSGYHLLAASAMVILLILAVGIAGGLEHSMAWH